MPVYDVSFTIDGSRIASVEKLIREKLGDTVAANVKKIERAESRTDRLGKAEASFEDAKNVVEELKDEMQNWYDSIPENLQNGDKANEVQEAIDALEELSSNLDNCQFDVSFPSMF